MKTKDQRKRVALVDDDPAVRDSLRHGFEIIGGFQVVFSCDSGENLLERLASLPPTQHPEIVLLEVSLKQRDGFQFCRELRQTFPDLTVAIHTTHCLPCFVNGARQADADAYFCKPVDLRHLASELIRLHRTECLLVDPRVLLGGVTGNCVLTRDPHLSPRLEQVLELEAQGWAVKQIAEQFKVGASAIYTLKREGLRRLESACRPAPESLRQGV